MPYKDIKDLLSHQNKSKKDDKDIKDGGISKEKLQPKISKDTIDRRKAPAER